MVVVVVVVVVAVAVAAAAAAAIVVLFTVLHIAGADPENCFWSGTLDLSHRRRRSETPKTLRGRGLYREFTPPPPNMGFERAP